MAIPFLSDISGKNATFAGDVNVAGNIILTGASNEIIKSNGSIRLNIDSDANQTDRVFIVSTGNNSELFRVDEYGHTLAQGVVKTDGYFQVNSSANLLRKYVSSWGSGAQSHDIIYNGWKANTGDYTYLKAAGKQILSSVGCYQAEKLGPQIIKSIKGDFFNVLGFPLFPFLSFLYNREK